MVEENIDTQDAQAPVQSQEPPVKVAPPESRFLFVDIAALRAKQLRRGARSRLPALAEGVDLPADAPRKPERVAMEEVRQGLVSYDLPEAKPAGETQ